MIKIFRNIRKKLVSENRSIIRNTNYFKYALGEIVLVVIGILIALQVNNWNETRKNRREEKVIINNLKEELLDINKDLQSKTEEISGSKKAVKELMGLFGKSKEEIRCVNTDSLIYFTLIWPEFNTTSVVIDDLLQSGKLHLVEDANLRKLIFKWQPTLDETKSQFDEMVRFNNDRVFEYLNRQVSFKNADRYGMVFWREKSVLEVDNTPLFGEIYYENMLEGQLFFFTSYENKIDDTIKLIDTILNEI